MKASFRKVQAPGDPAYQAVVHIQGRLLWACPHLHPTIKKATACARRHRTQTPSTRRGQLTHLRQTWQPRQTFIPTDPDDGRPILSRTFIENFLQCVQYQDDRSPEAAFGTAVHAAIHAYYQLCVATGQESSLGDIDRLVRDAFFATANGVEPNRYDEARELVWEFCTNQPAELNSLLVVGGRPGLECDLRADAGWFWLTGRADRIKRVDGDDPDDPPRVIRIEDIKTGWDPGAGRKKIKDRPRNPYPAPIPHEFQRRIYAWLAFNDPRINERLEAVETAILYPRNRREPEVLTYERSDLEAWFADVQWALTQRWQQRTGPPTGCSACEFCALRKTCGAATTDAKVVPDNLDEAALLVGEWVRTKQRQDGQRKALQTFLRGRDMIVVSGLEIGFGPPREKTWKVNDPLGVVTALNARGFNGAAAMVTWIDTAMVPDDEKASLVEAGVARWDAGEVGWKMRKAGSDDDG